jgi:hypothetical protein
LKYIGSPGTGRDWTRGFILEHAGIAVATVADKRHVNIFYDPAVRLYNFLAISVILLVRISPVSLFRHHRDRTITR